MKYDVSVNFSEFCSLFKFNDTAVQTLPKAHQNLA